MRRFILAAVLTVSSISASGAERVVLGEYFTNLNCPTCAAAGPVVSNLIDLYGHDGSSPDQSGTFAVVQFHVFDAYQEPWGLNRLNFYGSIFDGTPLFAYDGLWDAWPISTYESKFLMRQAAPTPVTMNIGAEEIEPDRYEIAVRTCLEPDSPTVDLMVYMVVVEDHYPAAPSYSRNTFRVAAPTSVVTLAAGECSEVVEQVVVSPATEQGNLKIIAWAQEPNAAWPADVSQAAIIGWPFEPFDPPDVNGDGVVDVTDLVAVILAWGPCSECPEDVDGDGDVDVQDLVAVILTWGS
jgi:hypothetical protein